MSEVRAEPGEDIRADESAPPVSAAPSFDDLANGEPRRLALNSITVDRMGAWIAAGALGLPSLIAVIVLWLTLDENDMPLIAKFGMAAGWLLLALWLIWGATLYPRLYYDRASYTLSPQGIEIRRGVFWRHVLNIPRSRVQHTDVRHGPIARHFGLATLVIHTAGTQNHTVTLGGLERDMAMRIRDFLIRGGDRDGV